jgi:hypothetical protein
VRSRSRRTSCATRMARTPCAGGRSGDRARHLGACVDRNDQPLSARPAREVQRRLPRALIFKAFFSGRRRESDNTKGMVQRWPSPRPPSTQKRFLRLLGEYPRLKLGGASLPYFFFQHSMSTTAQMAPHCTTVRRTPSCGTHALRRGADLATVRDTLGHASIATTSRYLHARPEKSSAITSQHADASTHPPAISRSRARVRPNALIALIDRNSPCS